MKNHLPLYVLAGAILVVAVVGFGVPVSGLWVLVFVLCPLMMMFMMRGMHGGNSHGENGHLDGHSSGDLTKDRDRSSRLDH
jgi:hypothetical protein